MRLPIAQVIVLQAVCFKEVIGLSFQHSSVRRYVRPESTLVEEKEVPLFKAMNWYACGHENKADRENMVCGWGT